MVAVLPPKRERSHHSAATVEGGAWSTSLSTTFRGDVEG